MMKMRVNRICAVLLLSAAASVACAAEPPSATLSKFEFTLEKPAASTSVGILGNTGLPPDELGHIQP